MSAIDIVSIGEPMIEFNQTRPGEPNYLQGFGGDTSNMIIAAARAGARTAYVTRVGDDDFGRMFLALWKDEGVDTRGVAIDPQAHTGVYFVRHGPEGHVFSYLRAGSAASRMRPEDLPIALIREARYVYASGISMAISASAADSVLAAFEAARAAGAKVSFDSEPAAKAVAAGTRADADRRRCGDGGLLLPEHRGRARPHRSRRGRRHPRLGAPARRRDRVPQARRQRRDRERRREARAHPRLEGAAPSTRPARAIASAAPRWHASRRATRYGTRPAMRTPPRPWRRRDSAPSPRCRARRLCGA